MIHNNRIAEKIEVLIEQIRGNADKKKRGPRITIHLQIIALFLFICICTTTAGATTYVNSFDQGFKKNSLQQNSDPADPVLKPTVLNGSLIDLRTTGTDQQEPDIDKTEIKLDNESTVIINNEPVTLIFGQIINSSIRTPGENHSYTFSAENNDVIIITTRTSWTNGSYIKLYAPDNTLIAEQYENESVNILHFSIDKKGVYKILVEDYDNDQIGSYTLNLQRPDNKILPPEITTEITSVPTFIPQETPDIGNKTFANATPVTVVYGQTINSSISVLGQMNTYNFTASAGDIVVVRSNSSWDNGPQVRIYQPNNTIIAEHSGYGCNFNEIQFNATKSGAYTFTIEDSGNDQTGTYSMHITTQTHSVNEIPAEVISVPPGLPEPRTSGELRDPRDPIQEVLNIPVQNTPPYEIVSTSGDDPYVFVTKWGTRGGDDGQFEYPIDVAVDPLGNVYVSDWDNNRIQKFSSDGTFLAKWGISFGGDDGQFYEPYAVAVDSTGNVYVADSGNHRIQKFNSTGTFLTKWGSTWESPGSGDGQFSRPSGVAVDSTGNVYVADLYNQRIQKFSTNGTFLAKWGTKGTGDGQFNEPYRVAVDSTGNVYVADTGTWYNSYHRIQKFSSTGTFLTKWGTAGEGDGQFSYLKSVAVDSSDNVYVADTSNNRIQKFSANGTFLAKWGSKGTGDGQFQYPWGVAVDSSGNVYVADTNNDRIQKFAPQMMDSNITNVYPKSVKNSSSAYLNIYGRNFTSPMNVELRKQNIVVASAKSVVVALSSTLIANFDLTQVPDDTYDLVVIWPDGTQKTKLAAVSVSALPTGGLIQSTDMILSSDGTVSYSFDVPPTTHDLFITLQKSTYPTDAHWSWTSKITLSHDGNVTATSTSNQDPIIQIKNPEPGPYTITIKATEAGKGILTILTSLPDLPAGEWIVDTIQRPFGSSFHQVNVSAEIDRLMIEAETMNTASFLRIYYDKYGGSPKWITTYGQTKVTIPHPTAGRYIVEFVDPMVLSSSDQKRDILLRATTELNTDPTPTYNPVISGFTPARGGNTGIVTLQINGGWLDPNSTAILSKGGAGNLTALSVEGSVDRRSLTALFDLEGKAPGSYTLTLHSPNGIAVTAPTSFLIEEGGKSELWTELTGMDKIRIGRPAKYILKYGNSGNLDMPAPLVVITSDPPTSHLSSRILPNGAWKPMGTDGMTLRCNGSDEKPDTLSAGSSFSMELQVTTDVSEEFTLNVVPFGGDPMYSPGTLESVTDIAVPGPGMPLIFGRTYPARFSSYSGSLGNGWVHTYDFRLVPFEDGTLGLKSGDTFDSTFTFQSDGSWTNEGGNIRITKNPADGKYTLTSKDGSKIEFASTGLPLSLTDPNANRITLVYTGGKLTGIQHSDGDSLTLAYNGNNRIASVSGPAGRIATYSYSTDGTLLTEVTNSDTRVTRYSYQQNGPGYAIVSITRPGNFIENYQYDGDGRLSGSSVNGQKEAVPIQYDEGTRSTTIKDAVGTSVEIRVNERGQVIQQENALGQINKFTYDADGNLTKITGPAGNSYQFERDSSGKVTSMTDPLNYVTRFTYHPQFETIKTVTDPQGNTIRFNYDSHANIVGVLYPDSRSESMSYDSGGNLVTSTSRKGDIRQYTYNSKGQQTRIGYPDGKLVAYAYDPAGNLVEATSSEGTIAMSYNARNEMISVSYPGGIFFNYTYDSAGHLTEREDKEGQRITYAYDDQGHLISVGDKTGNEYALYSYDSAGRLIKKVVGNGAYTTFEYDQASRILRLVNVGTTGTNLSKFEYQYDKSGNPVQIGTLEGNYVYKYDALGQLTEVTFPDSTKEQYTYDAAGNRISTTVGGVVASYSTNNMNQYTQTGSSTFTYDNNGNMVSRTENGNTTTYEYNYENRLTKVISPAGTWDYTYDALGNRVAVTHDGIVTRYAVDPSGFWNIAAEYAANGTLKSKYVHGMGLLAMVDAGDDTFYYHFNPTGHTSEITSESGSVMNRYQYAPFGEYRQKTEGIANPFTYVGEYGVMDDGNGLHYMRMRFYSSNLGRFVSEDPLNLAGGDINLYNYGNNNPIQNIDPTGLGYLDINFNKPEYIYLKLSSKWHAGACYEYGVHVGEQVPVGFNPDIGAYRYMTKHRDFELLKKFLAKFPYAKKIVPKIFKYGGTLSALINSATTGWDIGRLLGQTPLLTDPSMTYDQFYQELFSKLFFKTVTPVTSVDPEDKYGPTGYDPTGTQPTARNRYITDQSPLNYRVDFWNAETATANVCDVDAYDQMDSDLNWSTFQFTEVGFTDWTVPLEPTHYFNVNIDTRPTMPYIVQIEGIYNPATGRANLTYHTLNATTLETPEDPLAGFLPPISSNGDEIGWFSYTVQPKQGLSTGTVIENRAFVNFDYSQFMPAPKDAPWINTIDAGKPASSVTATLQNQTEIHLEWTGNDYAGGSGIKDYTIYVSTDTGPYLTSLNHMTGTSAVMNGVPGHSYALYSIARDNVGNQENTKTSPDATVTIPGTTLIQAALAGTPTSGTAPLTVTFTDMSTGSPTSWNWSFGDGVLATAQHPVHTYSATGSYTVSLTVMNSVGNDTITRSNYITVNAASGVDSVGVFRGGVFYRNGADPIVYGLSTDTPVVGDWNGDLKSEVGVFRDGVFYLRNSDGSTTPIVYGISTDTPVVGDWNGDLKSEVGVYRDGVFYRNGADAVVYGLSTDTPVVGDWNGDLKSEVGVYRDGVFYRNGADAIVYGISTDTPVIGDWNEDLKSEVGVYRDGVFYRNGADAVVYGISTDTPVIGDWNVNLKSEVGIYRDGVFYRNGADAIVYGLSTDTPVIGDWNGDLKSEVGVYRDGVFYRNGADAVVYGISTDTPVVGDWNGDHISEVGVYRDGVFYRNGADAIVYGLSTDTPVVGDWNGDLKSEVGVYRDGVFYRNGADAIVYGLSTDTPVVGDWNGDSISEVGVFRDGVFYRNGADPIVYGLSTDTPVVGTWT